MLNTIRFTAIIALFISLSCTPRTSTEKKNGQNPAEGTATDKRPQKNKSTKPKTEMSPPFYGRWTLDHNAYRVSAAFQALKPKQQQAAISMLNKLQTDMTIGDGFIHKIGRFNERQVVTKMNYTVSKRMGEVWMIDVQYKGKSRTEQWRMSEKHLVINVDGKDRIYTRVSGTTKPMTPSQVPSKP